ncbi:MAG: sugar phosphate isomerase/epimerase [Planctomycetaceae bacterium]|jgi:hexulose-6-phosphate isomerase|nr:sugar phosphate isomerase/epimerase [Planctomycetaceae bacterium]
MSNSVSRRQFLGTSATVAAGIVAASQVSVQNHSANAAFAQTDGTTSSNFKTQIFKAAIVGEPDDKKFESLVNAGFEGVETTAWNTTPEKAATGRLLAEKHGLRIHSVMRGWANFNADDKVVRQKTIDETATALRAAAAYGADTILLVPCKIGSFDQADWIPTPQEFKIAFDPKTLKVNKVADGDSAKFEKYIQQQNIATETSIEAVNSLIPLAAELGVVIGIENVWNNLWVKPEFFAAFVRSFDNIWVRTYLDLGNHAKYAPPEEWVATCGTTIIKTHCKDFLVDSESKDGGSVRNFRRLYEGNINWSTVRRALDAVNYNGWMSDETGAAQDSELIRRMNAIIAGEQLKIG